MSIPATQSTNPSTANVAARTASAAKSSTLNYDTFLRLLMAQMKNQDPTAPMKSTDYTRPR